MMNQSDVVVITKRRTFYGDLTWTIIALDPYCTCQWQNIYILCSTSTLNKMNSGLSIYLC